jgi:hypothetical protein
MPKLLGLLSAVVALGCAAAAPSTALAACDPIDPSACLHPFPNDFFTVDAATPTGKRVALPQDGMPKNRAGKPIDVSDLNRADGFSPGSSIITKVPGLETLEAFRASKLPPIDDPRQSLDKHSPVAVINARTGKRHLVWAEIDSNPADPADRVLIIRPAKNFDEGERYLVALSNLRRADGERIPAGDAFAAFRDREAEGARAEDMERIFRGLKKAHVKRKNLYLAWDFTVASADSTTGRMLSIRDRAFAGLGDTNLADRQVAGSAPIVTVNPDLPDDFEIPDDVPVQADGVVDYDSGAIARKIRGKLVLPCYLNAPGCPTGSQFQIGADGKPVQIPGNTTTYDWSCNIPRGHETVRPLLYGHGLLGQQDEIDWGGNPDFAAQHGYLYCAVDWNGMAFKDIPNVLTILQDLSRFPTLVDHIQQGYLGFLFLGRSLIHADGITNDPAFNVEVDRGELFYDGNSQGGIYGGTLLAIAPDHERAVLGVPGMNYSTLLHRSVDFDQYAEGNFEGAETEFGLYDQYPNELERPLIFAIMQMLWDRADPNGYAAHLTSNPLPNTPTHKALLQVGFGDHQVADVTTEVEARTAGMRVHRPLLARSRERYRGRPYPNAPLAEPFQGVLSLGVPGYSFDGSGVVFYDTGNNPAPWAANIPPREGDDPHENVRRTPAARIQKAEFLKTGGAIVDVCGGPCQASR